MSTERIDTEVIVAGAGLAGIVCAYELLDQGKKVLLLDKDTQEAFGGLGKESFGGVHMIGTPHQRRTGIKDSPELAWRDWQASAQFEPGDEWPRAWAQLYCERSIPTIFEFLDQKKVEFLPLVNWPERGWDRTLNSVPRWHITWGTGRQLLTRVIAALESHPRRAQLDLRFSHSVDDLEVEAGKVVGVRGHKMDDDAPFSARAQVVVIASGGMCGGDLSKVRQNWYKPWGEPPEIILNGAHRFGDGALQDRAAAQGASLTHLDKQWHYAAGVHHPKKRRPHDGLSLVPPRSALWMNARGERIGPEPLVAYTDTRHLVEEICKQPGKYSWQILNRRIAEKELAVSGSDYMHAFRLMKKSMLVRHVLFGNKQLVDDLVRDCPDDIVIGRSLDELCDRMQEKSLFGMKIDRDALKSAVAAYDAQIDRGPAYFNDEQLRRLLNYRTYRGDRVRTCKFQKIVDDKAMPLIAIREFIMARKSLGGLKTDLEGRVLKASDGQPIPGLYAVGEAAGFGGGGSHGLGSLEGTFLGGCVLTGRVVGQSIATGKRQGA